MWKTDVKFWWNDTPHVTWMSSFRSVFHCVVTLSLLHLFSLISHDSDEVLLSFFFNCDVEEKRTSDGGEDMTVVRFFFIKETFRVIVLRYVDILRHLNWSTDTLLIGMFPFCGGFIHYYQATNTAMFSIITLVSRLPCSFMETHVSFVLGIHIHTWYLWTIYSQLRFIISPLVSLLHFPTLQCINANDLILKPNTSLGF